MADIRERLPWHPPGNDSRLGGRELPPSLCSAQGITRGEPWVRSQVQVPKIGLGTGMMVTSGGANLDTPLELNLQETCPAGVVAVNEVPVRNPDRLKSNATWSAETEMQSTRNAVPSDHRLRQSKLFLQNVFSIAEGPVHPGTQRLQISNVLNSIVHRYVHRVGMSFPGDGVAPRDGRFATANAGIIGVWLFPVAG
jgi:hypothetical protein